MLSQGNRIMIYLFCPHIFFFRLCSLRQLYIRIIVTGLNSTLTSSVDTNSSPQFTLRKEPTGCSLAIGVSAGVGGLSYKKGRNAPRKF